MCHVVTSDLVLAWELVNGNLPLNIIVTRVVVAPDVYLTHVRL